MEVSNDPTFKTGVKTYTTTTLTTVQAEELEQTPSMRKPASVLICMLRSRKVREVLTQTAALLTATTTMPK